MKIVLLIMISLVFTSCMVVKKTNTETVVIQTNAECGQCKERIEGELNYVKGVRFAELDVPTKQLKVSFNADKITEAELKQKVAEIGYDADEVKAVPSAQQKLPACCQPGGMKK